MAICPKCDFYVDDNAKFCANCGSPIQQDDSPEKQIKKIIGSIILIVVLIVGIKILWDYCARVIYKQRAEECAYLMIDGAADAEDACNMICAVWSNTIFEIEDSKTDKYTLNASGYFNDDFNDALGNLFDDPSFQDDLADIQNNLDEVNDKMKHLQHAPKGCEKMHDLLTDYYDEYYELMNCALNPSGNLFSYMDEFYEADEKAVKYFDKLTLLF